jgi:hypothetical protein
VEEFKPVAKDTYMATPGWLWLFVGTTALLAYAAHRSGQPRRNPLPPFPSVGPLPPMHIGPAFWLGPMAVI